jgi:hypothetical protein
LIRVNTFQKYFLAALAVFVLAGATGAFLRFGVLYGMGGLSYANVRHAHSHLMYFGWVTPAIMALMASRLPQLTGRPLSLWFARLVPLIIGLGLLAYAPFLFFGYRLVEVGAARMPLSVIAASLNVLAWYVFAWVYWRQARGAPPTRALRLMNAAVVFLMLSTIGTIGLPIITFAGIEDPLLSLIFTHIFLDLFSEGWFVLAILGLAYAAFPKAARHPWARLSGDLLFVGLPVVFLLYLPVSLVPPSLRWIGSVGGLLVVAGTLGNVAALWPSVSAGWRAPLAFLTLKGVAQIGILIPAVAQWAEVVRLRVPYLHWLLLGFATLGLFAAAEGLWGVAGRRWMTAAVTLLILTLIPLTGVWPLPLGGLWTLHAAAWAALGPVAVAIAVLLSPARRGARWAISKP